MLLGADLDLSGLQAEKATGLVIQASQKVTIRPRDAGQKVTLRYSYDGHTPGTTFVALKLLAPQTHVEGVRFIVDAHQSEVRLTSLHLRGGKHLVQRCEFIQAQPSFHPGHRFASLVVEEGPAEALFTAPREERTRRFLQDVAR